MNFVYKMVAVKREYYKWKIKNKKKFLQFVRRLLHFTVLKIDKLIICLK